MTKRKYKLGLDKYMYIECLTCNKRSYNVSDIKYRFCPKCGFFLPEIVPVEILEEKNNDFE